MSVALRHQRRATPTVAPAAPPDQRPDLRLVPGRRRAARFVIVLAALVCLVMAGAAVLHTQLAARQLEIDRLDRALVIAQERFDVLRSQRAELRAPIRLATEAARLGLQPASATEFVPVDPATVARVVAAAGRTSAPTAVAVEVEPLDQFRRVKAANGIAP
ncbi:MAG: hypothetical protein MUE78_02915 [Ilumatobacteraceae bacterium]|nr:hypothetical protein [Ilumatobacteraceae bacterium]